VYIAPDPPTGEFVKLASYDLEDYYKYFWDNRVDDWRLTANRYTVEELRCLYAPGGCSDSTWMPQDYPRSSPLILTDFPDSVFYFEPIYANAYRFGLETPFEKRFPEARKPGYRSVADVPADSADTYLTDDGYFKYYDYEYTITDLLPGEEYAVSVTSFDHGSFASGAEPLESAIAANIHIGTPSDSGLSCCVDPVGNVNCDPENTVDITDLQALVDHFFLSLSPLCCPEEADLSGHDGVDMLDLQLLIDHLHLTHSDLGPCPSR
jgi:hypothetical protein